MPSLESLLCACFKCWPWSSTMLYGEGELVSEQVEDTENLEYIGSPPADKRLEQALSALETGNEVELPVRSDLALKIMKLWVNAGITGDVACLAFSSCGLYQHGQKEIITLIELQDNVRELTRQMLVYYKLVYEFAEKGKYVDVGDHTEIGGHFLNDDVAGFIYAARDSQDVDRLVLPESPCLFAVLFRKDELDFVQNGLSVRVLLRLGMRTKCFPFPIVSNPSRHPVYDADDFDQSILSKMKPMRVDGLRVFIEGGGVTVQIPVDRRRHVHSILTRAGVDTVVPLVTSPGGVPSWAHLAYAPEEIQQPVRVDGKDDDSLAQVSASFLCLCAGVDEQMGVGARVVEDGVVASLPATVFQELLAAILKCHEWALVTSSEHRMPMRLVWTEQRKDTLYREDSTSSCDDNSPVASRAATPVQSSAVAASYRKSA